MNENDFYTKCANCLKRIRVKIDRCEKRELSDRNITYYYYVCPKCSWTYPFTIKNLYERSEKL